ncbi:GNAT family N-acetyltransferase [Amycolatopsis sp. NPDC059027]|uniref:GNAT family N-acetyltransferase n=1 Tax=Amycolatopsis sp. NPDC059027 TaxID=3346709 RepID=UPI00366D488F
MRRQFGGADDLRAMQELTQRIWTPESSVHIGDLSWQRYQSTGREAEWPTAIWAENDTTLAWGWVTLPGELMLQVDPARPELAAEVLAWFAEVATSPTLTVTIVDAEKHVSTALETDGYSREERAVFETYMSRDLDDLPEPVVPQGFHLRPCTADDLARRVAVHQAVWHPSRVTEESYANVMRAWPYRADLDWVVEAPDGDFAAQCLIWLDDHNGAGELEPVGTDPRYRGKGLGRAVCLAALHALRAAGAHQAVVYPVIGHPKSVGAVPLYQSLGFRAHARSATWVKRRLTAP